MMLTNNFHLYMPMYGLEAPSQYLVILKLKYPNLLLVVNYESRSLSGVNVALVAWVHLASVAPLSRLTHTLHSKPQKNREHNLQSLN
jgi:hypothetical protein